MKCNILYYLLHYISLHIYIDLTNITVIHTTLTKNSTTLYTSENFQLIHSIQGLNCSEIIAQELGLINASKTLIGLIPITSNSNIELALYFIKKVTNNPDGSSDLITIVSIAHVNINKALVLSILKKIMDKYIDFKQDVERTGELSNDKARAKLGEFKLYMNQIIKFEEMNYDSNQRIYNYGSINRNDDGHGGHNDEELNSGAEVINPDNLVLANEEVEEVRLLMLDNIQKLMKRGDKINLLVDQTDRLTNSSSVFQKRAQFIKHKMWLNKSKFFIMVILGIIVLLYLILGTACGFPLFNSCFHS